MGLDQDTWFSEIYDKEGSAFSLKIRAKLHEETTPYQHIEIYDTERFGKLMVIDGCTMVSTRDNFLYHEMMSHPALFIHGNAKRVLIIGGGDCGTLREVLKHDSVTEAVQVDIDERVTRLSEQYFPELTASNDDPRANLEFADGVRWIEDSPKGYYDIIIIDSTDPVGFAKGLFTAPFYQKCHHALAEDGILIQQSESPLYHLDLIEDMHNAMREVGFEKTKLICFPQCIYPSGWWSASMARKQGHIDLPANAEPSFDTEYYNADILAAAMAEPNFVRRRLGAVKS